MKVVLALFALLGYALAYPQFTRILTPDSERIIHQDESGQFTQTFTAPGISRSDSLVLKPDGKGDYVPFQRTESHHIAPSGVLVKTVIEAGPQGAVITGSHVPTA